MQLSRTARVATRRPAAAAVEAALVLPFLAFFAGGIYDLGCLTKAISCTANGARNGAQVAATNSSGSTLTASIRSAVMTEMSGLPNTSTTNPDVSTTMFTRGGSTFVKVKVTYNVTGLNFTPLFPVSSVSRTVEMRQMPSY